MKKYTLSLYIEREYEKNTPTLSHGRPARQHRGHMWVMLGAPAPPSRRLGAPVGVLLSPVPQARGFWALRGDPAVPRPLRGRPSPAGLLNHF